MSSALRAAAARPLWRYKIGAREVVGPSVSGFDEYIDRVDVPCPAIRYKPPSPEANALWAREKGDWKSISIEDKKKLYRLSFCQTIAELEAPTCEGRRVFGGVLMLLCVPLIVFVILKKTVYPPVPDTMSDDGKKKMIRWYIDARVDPIDGISSKWDYENKQWKEKPYWLMRSN